MTTQELNVITFGGIPWGLSRALPVLLALTLGGGAVDAIVKGIGEVQWLADGLTLAGKMLPALGFAILLRYLPVKRNLHYLALGFAVTAMLTTIYTNLTSAGTAIATVVKDFDAAPFKRSPYDWYCDYRGSSCEQFTIRMVKMTGSSAEKSQHTEVSESGEIEDTKSNYKLTKEDFKQIK